MLDITVKVCPSVRQQVTVACGINDNLCKHCLPAGFALKDDTFDLVAVHNRLRAPCMEVCFDTCFLHHVLQYAF